MENSFQHTTLTTDSTILLFLGAACAATMYTPISLLTELTILVFVFLAAFIWSTSNIEKEEINENQAQNEGSFLDQANVFVSRFDFGVMGMI
jgi:hypothetical protein